MDLQKFIDGFDSTSCVMSVQVYPDGSWIVKEWHH